MPDGGDSPVFRFSFKRLPLEGRLLLQKSDLQRKPFGLAFINHSEKGWTYAGRSQGAEKA